MKPGFDEMHDAGGAVREHYGGYDRWLQEQPPQVMQTRRDEAEVIFWGKCPECLAASQGSADDRARSPHISQSDRQTG